MKVKMLINYKENPTSEIFGAIGLLSELNLIKFKEISNHLFKPKMLLRYAPGQA